MLQMFATKKVTLPPGRHKIVILDEADSMTSAAQQALRRTMELHSATTRFALACNNSTKIIEPIQSRCAVLRYARLTDEEMLKRLLEVCAAESVPFERTGLEAILFTADGDMRNALNSVQSTFAGFGRVCAGEGGGCRSQDLVQKEAVCLLCADFSGCGLLRCGPATSVAG